VKRFLASFPPGPRRSRGRGARAERSSRRSLLDFTLTDQDGKPWNLAKDRKGRPVLLTFIFTRCPGACPYVVETCVATARKTGTKKDPASKPLVVALSFDPEYDTPERLRAYAEERGITKKEATFLTGDPARSRRFSGMSWVSATRRIDLPASETVVIARTAPSA
jgi:cytochrome oxidase Cu insertion factor (SCO1/SenC/PrrC family)